MDEAQKNRLRDYAWKYFEFHAEQRLKTFHLYLILVASDIAAFAATLKITDNSKWISIYGLLLLFLSVVFGKLDIRNKELVKNGENALKHLDELEGLEDKDNKPNVLKIFTHDDYMSSVCQNDPILGIHITYSKFLAVVYRTIGLLGLGTAFFFLIK